MSERKWIGPPNSASAWTALARPSDSGLIRLAFREATDRMALASQLERWRAALARVQADVLVLPDFMYDGGDPVLTFPSPAVVGANLPDAHTYADTMAQLGVVAEALDALHDSGIVHGALAAHSLWWSSTGRLRFPDAGLAHALEGVVGAPADASPYRAPEFWHGQPRTRFSDQYSLAVMAYEWFTGHKREVDTSFEGFTSIEPLMLEPAALRAAGAPIELADVLQRALSFTPTARYATCREFIDELKAQAARLAQPESLPDKRLRWNGRTLPFQSWGTVARFAAALVVIVLLGTSVDSMRRAASFSWLKRLAPMTRVEVRSPQAAAQTRTAEERLREVLPAAGGAASNPPTQATASPKTDSSRPTTEGGGSLAKPELPTVVVDVQAPTLDATRLLDRATGSSNSRNASTTSQGASNGRIADSRSPTRSGKLPAVRVPTLFIDDADGKSNANAASTSARVDAKAPAILLLTVPSDSRVYVDGVLSRNKTQIEVAPGSHDITVLSGSTRVQRRISLAAGDTVTVRLALP